MPSLPRRPSPREKKTVDVSTASGGCPARQPASYHARRKYEVLSQEYSWKKRRGIPAPARILPTTRNHPESLGTCLPHPATRIFLWPRWQARAPWISCGQPVRQDCICENRSVGSGRPPLVDHRGQSCGRTVAGSELNLLVLIVLVFFDLDAQRLQKFHVLIVHLKIRIRGHRGH